MTKRKTITLTEKERLALLAAIAAVDDDAAKDAGMTRALNSASAKLRAARGTPDDGRDALVSALHTALGVVGRATEEAKTAGHYVLIGELTAATMEIQAAFKRAGVTA